MDSMKGPLFSIMDRAWSIHEGPIVTWTAAKSGPIWDQSPKYGDRKAVQSGKVFLQQVRVDGKCGLRPFRGRDDDPLDRARGVARHVQAREVRRLVLPGADGALLVDLASEEPRELRLLRLTRREEDRLA